MLAGMGFMAVLCFITGVYPKVLYNILPFEVHFHPYTPDHLAGTMGILLAAILGYKLLQKKFVMHDHIVQYTDRFYRMFGGLFLRFCSDILDTPGRAVQAGISKVVAAIGRLSKDSLYEPEILITQARPELRRNLDRRRHLLPMKPDLLRTPRWRNS